MIRIIILIVVTAIISIPQIPIWAADAEIIAKAGCPDDCGGVKIPFPFGIGDGCFFDSIVNDPGGNSYGNIYEVTCDSNVLRINGTAVLNITYEEHSLRINSKAGYDCYANGTSTNYDHAVLSMAFSVSPTKNTFVATGCDTYGYIEGYRYGNDSYYSGCMTYCTSMDHIQNGTCSGVGCCEAPVPDGTTNISVWVESWDKHTKSPGNNCSSGFIVENGAYTFSTADLTAPESHFEALYYPMLLDWSILGKGYCNRDATLCGSNTTCIDPQNNTDGYRCKCLSGYTGNPYLSQGCTDFDECTHPGLNKCDPEHGLCVNTLGSSECKCRKGFHGVGTIDDRCTAKQGWNSLPVGVRVCVGFAIGLVFLLIGNVFGCLYYQRKQLLDEQNSFFKKNGGLILRKKLSGQDMSVQKIKIFTSDELERATTNFSGSNKLGKGVDGKVYNKVTLRDGQVVAIKKSTGMDHEQISQFINEMLLLSEINNKNVVKLLGCCLDTDVPYLVYEFINNGTLYEHLEDERKASLLSLDIRLRIAEAVASVLSYLHNTIAIPIIHGDIKSMNILLDDNYTAKVADFGASKLSPSDQDEQAATNVSKHEYLDPEYEKTKVLTKKSDVYSFGVVLVELLTKKKATVENFPESKTYLSTLCEMEEDHLLDIVDHSIWMNDQQVNQVVKLAIQCLKPTGVERPTMKQIAMELEYITTYIRISGISTSYLAE